MKPARANPRTLLISMPFYSVRTPSLQLGLLCAIGKAHEFTVEALHLNLDFAVQVGRDLMRSFASTAARSWATGFLRQRRSAKKRPIGMGDFLTTFPMCLIS